MDFYEIAEEMERMARKMQEKFEKLHSDSMEFILSHDDVHGDYDAVMTALKNIRNAADLIERVTASGDHLLNDNNLEFYGYSREYVNSFRD